jgi:hypothetical protein
MDLQQKSWLSEVRITSAGSVICDKRLWSPEKQAFSHSHLAFSQLNFWLLPKTGPAKC